VTAGLEACVTAVNDWCASKRLQLNTNKTEVMWFGSATNLSTLSAAEKLIKIGQDTILPSAVVRDDLGVYSELNMKSHISQITRVCFYHLRRLRAVRRQLGQVITARLVSAFVLSRLNYYNALLAELPASTLAPLQRVMNASARLVCDLSSRDHVTPALQSLHWLPIKQRIQFKLCLLVHLTINGKAPIYLTEIITRTASIAGRTANRSAQNNDLVIQRTKLKFGQRAFSVAGPRIWNSYQQNLKLQKILLHLNANLKHISFPLPILSIT